MEVSHSEGKKLLWEVIETLFVHEPKDNDDIGLRGFDFNFIDEDKRGEKD